MIYIPCNSTEAAYYFAIEEYLMTQKKFDDTVFMFWNTHPTVMLGNGQSASGELCYEYINSNNVSIVRRQSGGGAIYTDEGGWQFSYVLPRKKTKIPEFHETGKDILSALISLGIDAHFNDHNDIMLDTRKISGNARHLTSSYILHHGSLLYNTNIEAMVSALNPPKEKLASKGIQSVRQRVCNISEYVKFDSFENSMLEKILIGYEIYNLTADEKKIIEQIADGKYRSDAWTYSIK